MSRFCEMRELPYFNALGERKGDRVQDQHIPFDGVTEPAGTSGISYGEASSKLEQLHDVLVDILLEETSIHQRRSPFDWVASFCLHIAIVGVFIVLPLYFTTGLDAQKLNLTFLAAPMMPAAAPPPASMASAPRPTHTTPRR